MTYFWFIYCCVLIFENLVVSGSSLGSSHRANFQMVCRFCKWWLFKNNPSFHFRSKWHFKNMACVESSLESRHVLFQTQFIPKGTVYFQSHNSSQVLSYRLSTLLVWDIRRTIQIEHENQYHLLVWVFICTYKLL